MDFNKNWHKSKERLTAFWDREIVDRCCIAVTAPKKGSKYEPWPLPMSSGDWLKYRTDGETIVKRQLALFENTYYGGDAFPQIFLDLGAAGHAGYFKNSRYQIENTVWFFPSINDWEEDEFEFDPDSFLYKKTLELAEYFVRESKGRYFVSMPDNAGNADALAHLRGSENLLMDFAAEPDRITSALGRMQDVWLKVSSEVYNIISSNNEGGSTIGWLNTWAPGKHAQMQCDLAVMISPDMFNGYIMPELVSQSDWLDYPLYHFDGMEQIRHLDALLSIDRLKAIQWQYVAGQPSPTEFIPVLQKIQNAGKGLLIFAGPAEVETLMNHLSSKGLFLVVNAASEDEARDIEKMAEKLTRD